MYETLPVVLVPGLNCSARLFAPQIPALFAGTCRRWNARWRSTPRWWSGCKRDGRRSIANPTKLARSDRGSIFRAVAEDVMHHPIIAAIRRDLKQNADAATKATAQKFFKETIKTYGVKTPVVGKIAKAHFGAIKDLDKDAILTLCEDFWRSGYMEEAFVACNWAERVSRQFEPKDFGVLERWVHDYVGNWATCDTLCNHTVAAFVETYPDQLVDLKRWARSKNRWVRRAAAVTLIIPARHGKFLNDIFAIADILICDGDDLVQKGCGWMLKAASEAHQKEVFAYVMTNKAAMPRTALRYAIEKMPRTLKAQAMRK